MAKRKAASGKGRKKPASKSAKKKPAKKAAKKSAPKSVYDKPPPRSKTPFRPPVLSPVERQLEEGLKQSFPASDPPAVTEPAAIRAGKDKPPS